MQYGRGRRGRALMMPSRSKMVVITQILREQELRATRESNC